MCFTAGWSIASFLTGWLSGAFFFWYNRPYDRAMATLFMGISTMQIAEFVIHMDPDCQSGLNQLGQRLAYIALVFAQPLSGVLGAVFFGRVERASPLILFIVAFLVNIYENWNFLAGPLGCAFKTCASRANVFGDVVCALDYPHQPGHLKQALYVAVLSLPLLSTGVPNKLAWLCFSWGGVAVTKSVAAKGKYTATVWCFILPLIVGAFQWVINRDWNWLTLSDQQLASRCNSLLASHFPLKFRLATCGKVPADTTASNTIHPEGKDSTVGA